MNIQLTSDFEEVFAHAQKSIPGLLRVENMVGIGMKFDGEMVASSIYENLGTKNVWIHLAGTPGVNWLNRRFIKTSFRYPFVTCGVDRVSAYILSSNLASIRFTEHIGFTREATLKGAANDGGDVFIYRLFKKDCRYVDQK